MIFKSMKKFFIFGLIAVSLIFTAQTKGICAAHKVPTVAVLSDTGHRNGTTYIICGAAADIIASDLINELNKTGRIKAPLLGENMSKITQKNIPLYYLTFFQEYKYNYNIDFVNLKRVTKNLNADYLIMITSGLDVQSNFLKETWWNKLSIAGSDPVVPTYKLTTLITLIDTKTYSIVWQDLYLRDISAHNYDLGIVQFSPSYAQLSKIKKYSKNVSQYVTAVVDKQVNPWIVPPQKPRALVLRKRFLNEGTTVAYPAVDGKVVRQNYREFQEKQQVKIDKMQKRRQIDREIRQQQHIENVRYKTKKQTDEKQQKEERLFDSIRNNIEDVSNSLPAAQEITAPAVEPKQVEENIKPAVNVEPKKEAVKVKSPIKPTSLKTQKQTVEKKQETPKKQLPKYQWNLRNQNTL